MCYYFSELLSAAESLFQKLARYADTYKKAKCYWVQILAKNSFCDSWSGDINGKEYSHSRVIKISGDKFYSLLTGQEDAFFALYKALPLAISDFLADVNKLESKEGNSAISEIKNSIEESDRTLFRVKNLFLFGGKVISKIFYGFFRAKKFQNNFFNIIINLAPFS